MRLHLAIAAGTALGGLSRYLVGIAVVGGLGLAHPVATLAVNLLGCLLIGAFATLTGPQGRLKVSPTVYQTVVTGFLGGFTTFSMLSVETLDWAHANGLTSAAVVLGLHLIAALAATWLGHGLATRYNASRPRNPG
ncbi:chromosome condensation protein CrcB [Ectothiorhodospira haloalkaliphila]|uniref:Fluoride-specific ion channel FluC n=1 Tax=Ectothiorhodospira haloalkaliphila TaxID=421628 RepID=W8KKC5_9GAMM|nr:CrcB family protein [Ectothiorhodospira haloalkaliphila]AHK80224.1 chromosome condensation protein CrcB [Ectothiorhodospira haloalkaliphila]